MQHSPGKKTIITFLKYVFKYTTPSRLKSGGLIQYKDVILQV